MTKSHEFSQSKKKALSLHVIYVSLIGLVLIASCFSMDASVLYSIKVLNESSYTVDLYQDGSHAVEVEPGNEWVCFVKEGESTTLEAKYWINGVLRTLSSDTIEGTNNWIWTITDSGSDKEKK